jgi:hypothetical protein
MFQNFWATLNYFIQTKVVSHETLPFALFLAVATPVIFPDLFFKRKNYDSWKDTKCKMIFFDVEKESENPYTDEPTRVSLYDPDSQKLFTALNIYNDDHFEELLDVVENMTKGKNTVYFITFDDQLQSSCLKSLLGEFLDTHNDIEFKFMDVKHMFYMTLPRIPHMSYDDVKDYYRVPELDCRPLETCAVMDQVIADHEVKIDNKWDKIAFMYEEVYG